MAVLLNYKYKIEHFMKSQHNIKSFLILGASIIFLVSCHRDGFLITKSGLHYNIIESFGKKKPQTGDRMEIHISYKTSRDSVLFDSGKMGNSLTIELQNPIFKGGLEEAFAMLGEGDSASFLICADSLYEKVFHTPRPSYIHKGEDLWFDVRLIKIKPPLKQAYLQQQRNASTEDLDILKYLAENNLMVNPRPSGFIYISFLDGKGKRPVKGNEVEVKYTASFLSGEMFDATDNKTGPLKFVLGDDKMIDAWEEGVSLMREGGKARFVIPSRLAYGEQGFGPIKPNTTIIYNVILEKINDVQ